MRTLIYALAFALAPFVALPLAAAPIAAAEDLVRAVASAGDGATIELAAGTFALSEPLVLKSGMTLKGAGMGKTILTNAGGWKGNPATLPDPETNFREFDRSGYLVHFPDKSAGITVSDLTLTGPDLHGAILLWWAADPHLHDLEIRDFLYSGVRAYATSGLSLHDCLFVDAGQRWERGKPGVKGGITGGGIFAIWLSDSEISNNRFLDTKEPPNRHYYGIKGRQGKRLKIHHNTIETNFSIEFPFENDEDVEISHNILHGTVSIPKHAGGPVPESGVTFRLHHNVFYSGYAIEFVRNGVEIDHNLFLFDAQKDGGNLISAFGKAPAKGPASFHNNLVSNPGRGVMWMNEPYANLTVRNNHIIARPTPTPRTEGLFGFNPESGFGSFTFRSNVIECVGQARPLFRNAESAGATLENNTLINVADSAAYQNPKTEAKAGLEAPLKFRCGVDGELSVDGWETALKQSPRPEETRKAGGEQNTSRLE
ncbi:MAG: right-handed parallel beta-helix repeat-containing protein [Verrucomicrobiales bacterium]